MFLAKSLKYFKLLTKDPELVSRVLGAKFSSSQSEQKPAPIVKTIINESYGQPTAETHPHLVHPKHLVTGVCREEFKERRTRLMRGILQFAHESAVNEDQKKANHLVIIPSATKKYMSDKIPYVFRQNSDFFYLTGCLEPDTVLMMFTNQKGDVKSILFMRPKDKHAELWDGPRTGVDNALEFFGVDEAYSIEIFQNILTQYLKNEDRPAIWYDSVGSALHTITEEVRQAAEDIPILNAPNNFVQSMRLFKSAAEQELMRQTCKIGAKAVNDVIKESRPGQSEHHLFAMVDYSCRMHNASHLAYPPVVASGRNATIIHYINNTQIMKSGDLVLMDAGCEYGGYSSDITRTWPVNGVFTEPQKVLYDVLLQLQKEVIGMLLKEGGDTLDNLFDSMCTKLGKYLQEVGLVPKDISTDAGLAKVGFKFCPHHVSHYLGMDVHDTPLIPRTLRLLPGMVFTVEPGIYIGEDRIDVPKEFRGIGIRIEDDVLITSDNKVEVLTNDCFKERVDLQNAFKDKLNRNIRDSLLRHPS